MSSPTWTEWGHYFQQIAMKIGGTISCIASAYIIQDVLRNPNKRSKSIYHRIMVGLSTMDILLSFLLCVLSSWTMPKGSWLWAVGDMVSCDVSAFLGLIGWLGSPLYNASLATFYSLKLKYGWTGDKMQAVEKWFHIIPWSIPSLYCIIGLLTSALGPSPGYCAVVVTGYPWSCDNPDSDMECSRGGTNFHTIFSMIGFLIILVSIFYVAIVIFRVYRIVRDIERDALQYSMSVRLGNISQEKFKKRSRKLMIQGVLYSAAMILTWIFFFLWIILGMTTGVNFEVLGYISYVVNPLQGLFNFFIYLIPVFREMIKTHRKKKEEEQKKVEEAPKGLKQRERKSDSIQNSDVGEMMEEEKKEIEALRPSFHLKSYEEDNDGNNLGSAIDENLDEEDDDENDDYF